MFEIEPHEVLIDKLAKEREKEISKNKFEIPIFEKPFFFFFLLILISFFIFLSKAFWLSFFKGKELSILAKENQFSILKMGAERGVIFDRNGEQLVFNQLSFDLYYQKAEKNEKEIEILSKILGIEKEKLKEKIDSQNENQILLEKNLDFKKALMILGQKEILKNAILKENWLRKYKEGKIFSHLIGYLGKISAKEFKEERDFYSLDDFVGKEGLEKQYEKILRKIPGKILIERDAKGRKIGAKIEREPKPGKSLVLHLDANLQRKIFEEMEKKIKETNAIGGAAVAVDPKTGGVLALVSLPSFDNNIFSLEDQKEIEKLLNSKEKFLFNRAVSGQYLLGSTIKPFLALAALKENLISEREKIECQGEIKIPHQYNPKIIYRFGDWALHGEVNVKKALAESCNVFFYLIGQKLGPQKIKEYLENFGFSKIPKVDFPSLSKGFIGDQNFKKENFGEDWWLGDTFNLSIGQGFFLVTPLQVAQAYLPIANGGKFLKLKFVWKILDEKGNLIEEFKPEQWRENFLDPEILKIVREGMRMAVTGEGAPLASAKSLSLLPVSAAAKTGSAQISKKECQNCYTVWISVFAPFEDPKILLVLMIDGVKDISSAVTIPVAKEILDWYFKNLSM